MIGISDTASEKSVTEEFLNTEKDLHEFTNNADELTIDELIHLIETSDTDTASETTNSTNDVIDDDVMDDDVLLLEPV